MATFVVDERQVAFCVLLAPGGQRTNHNSERMALRGQVIGIARRVFRVLAAGDHAGSLEGAQPAGEHGGRDALDRIAEFREAVVASKQVPDDD
jgi:hypothetical protein